MNDCSSVLIHFLNPGSCGQVRTSAQDNSLGRTFLMQDSSVIRLLLRPDFPLPTLFYNSTASDSVVSQSPKYSSSVARSFSMSPAEVNSPCSSIKILLSLSAFFQGSTFHNLRRISPGSMSSCRSRNSLMGSTGFTVQLSVGHFCGGFGSQSLDCSTDRAYCS